MGGIVFCLFAVCCCLGGSGEGESRGCGVGGCCLTSTQSEGRVGPHVAELHPLLDGVVLITGPFSV